MSIEMSSGCRDVEPEALMSSALQWSEGPLGIPNINTEELNKGCFDWIESWTPKKKDRKTASTRPFA